MKLSIYSVIFIISLLLAADTSGEVIFYDDIALKGKPFMLTAKTKGRFFQMGGQVVEFFVNDRSIGKNLSGGEGIALKEFVPEKKGLYRIRVESGKDKDEGLLLSLNKGESVVFIDVEGSLFEGPFSMKPKEKSQEAIKHISKRFPIVYLQTTIFGAEVLEDWLDKNGFQSAPILLWREGEIFEEVKEKGLRMKAIIGGPAVIESAVDERLKAFSFDDVEGAERVKDWQEIEKKMR